MEKIVELFDWIITDNTLRGSKKDDNGIWMSSSTKPLYFAAYLGFIFSIMSIMYIPYIIYAFYAGTEVQGWASVIATVAFFGGVNLMILGIIGIYLSKLFSQSKNRPHYIVKESNL